MVFLDVHFTCFHLLTYYSAHWLLWEFHTANDGLEALVGEGWLVAIQLNYSGDKINKVKQTASLPQKTQGNDIQTGPCYLCSG